MLLRSTVISLVSLAGLLQCCRSSVKMLYFFKVLSRSDLMYKVDLIGWLTMNLFLVIVCHDSRIRDHLVSACGGMCKDHVIGFCYHLFFNHIVVRLIIKFQNNSKTPKIYSNRSNLVQLVLIMCYNRLLFACYGSLIFSGSMGKL